MVAHLEVVEEPRRLGEAVEQLHIVARKSSDLEEQLLEEVRCKLLAHRNQDKRHSCRNFAQEVVAVAREPLPPLGQVQLHSLHVHHHLGSAARVGAMARHLYCRSLALDDHAAKGQHHR